MPMLNSFVLLCLFLPVSGLGLGGEANIEVSFMEQEQARQTSVGDSSLSDAARDEQKTFKCTEFYNSELKCSVTKAGLAMAQPHRTYTNTEQESSSANLGVTSIIETGDPLQPGKPIKYTGFYDGNGEDKDDDVERYGGPICMMVIKCPNNTVWNKDETNDQAIQEDVHRGMPVYCAPGTFNNTNGTWEAPPNGSATGWFHHKAWTGQVVRRTVSGTGNKVSDKATRHWFDPPSIANTDHYPISSLRVDWEPIPADWATKWCRPSAPSLLEHHAGGDDHTEVAKDLARQSLMRHDAGMEGLAPASEKPQQDNQTLVMGNQQVLTVLEERQLMGREQRRQHGHSMLSSDGKLIGRERRRLLTGLTGLSGGSLMRKELGPVAAAETDFEVAETESAAVDCKSSHIGGCAPENMGFLPAPSPPPPPPCPRSSARGLGSRFGNVQMVMVLLLLMARPAALI